MKEKRIEFSPKDLSVKAYLFYSGCSADFTYCNGHYYMNGERLADDIEGVDFALSALYDECEGC